jgi:RimJ/RimL family protein N-acetyltransferase
MIETLRLRLRALTDEDIEPWVAMFTDRTVTEYVSPVPLSREIAAAAAAHYRQLLATKGYGWWAIEIKGGASFAGAIMLQDVEFSAAFTPAVEVGWVLLPAYWGHGYAAEGARAALDYAFTKLNLDEVVALTAAVNAKSQRVMERLGMTHDIIDDFDHPHLPAENVLRRCVLYRMRRPAGD